jgi:serine protease Do
LVATNGHVVDSREGASSPDDDSKEQQPQPTVIAVIRSGAGRDEQSFPARILGIDREENRDLALVEVRGVKNPPEPIVLSELSVPSLDMPVRIFGFPFGEMIDINRKPPAITVNRGSVSSLRKDKSGRLVYLQIDGSINPGNSGGPIVDEQGLLVGVCVAKVSDTNIGFAIPAVELTEMLKGRVGEAKLEFVVQREPGGYNRLLRCDVPITDPLNHIKWVDLLVLPQGDLGAGAAPDAEGNWSELLGAKRIRLNRDGVTATAFLRERGLDWAPNASVGQVVYQLDTGELYRKTPTRLSARHKIIIEIPPSSSGIGAPPSSRSKKK